MQGVPLPANAAYPLYSQYGQVLNSTFGSPFPPPQSFPHMQFSTPKPTAHTPPSVRAVTTPVEQRGPSYRTPYAPTPLSSGRVSATAAPPPAGVPSSFDVEEVQTEDGSLQYELSETPVPERRDWVSSGDRIRQLEEQVDLLKATSARNLQESSSVDDVKYQHQRELAGFKADANARETLLLQSYELAGWLQERTTFLRLSAKLPLKSKSELAVAQQELSGFVQDKAAKLRLWKALEPKLSSHDAPLDKIPKLGQLWESLASAEKSYTASLLHTNERLTADAEKAAQCQFLCHAMLHKLHELRASLQDAHLREASEAHQSCEAVIGQLRNMQPEFLAAEESVKQLPAADVLAMPIVFDLYDAFTAIPVQVYDVTRQLAAAPSSSPALTESESRHFSIAFARLQPFLKEVGDHLRHQPQKETSELAETARYLETQLAPFAAHVPYLSLATRQLAVLDNAYEMLRSFLLNQFVWKAAADVNTRLAASISRSLELSQLLDSVQQYVSSQRQQRQDAAQRQLSSWEDVHTRLHSLRGIVQQEIQATQSRPLAELSA